VAELIAIGAQFTRRADDPDSYDLHREGGHSRRRILHADDLTGAEMVRALWAAVRAHPDIEVRERSFAVDLITDAWLARRNGALPPEPDRVRGAYLLDRATGLVSAVSARAVVLATGGSGKVYRYTTNPPIATGDGVAMAWRAGARVANLEFVQFHPTALFHPKDTSFLISEALRGEGGTLILPDGHRFMPERDARAELAPRDIVARAIDAEIKRHGLDHVLLDMTHMPSDDFRSRFPNIHARLLADGIDPAVTPIPVVPAAHYQCGGVVTDSDGATGVRDLYAVGEVACTGLHGANRLASNSLLEAIVYAQAAADAIGRNLVAEPAPSLPPWETGSAVDNDELVVIRQTWEEIRRCMNNYVGIVRTHKRLQRARRRIRLVRDEVRELYWDFRPTADLLELRNLATVADLIVTCALRRHESRGLHWLAEAPEADPRFLADTVLENGDA
jgi:L-aspartate oxidase